MVDVSEKNVTAREAKAGAKVFMKSETLDLIVSGSHKKGSVMPLPGWPDAVSKSGWRELSCMNNPGVHYNYFAHYFNRYLEFNNPHDGSADAVYKSSSPSPRLGSTNLYGKGNTIYIYTNIGNESGGNVYLSASLVQE